MGLKLIFFKEKEKEKAIVSCYMSTVTPLLQRFSVILRAKKLPEIIISKIY